MKFFFSLVVLTATAVGTVAAETKPLSLAGSWRFQLDRADAGVAEKWCDRALPHKIKLPGGLTEQGIGDPVTVDTKWIGGIVDKSWFTAPEFAAYRQPSNVKVPFWLQPELYYAGAAWFQRDVTVPKSWAGKRVVLHLERPHWETRVWVDGNLIGTNNALATPHEYDLGQLAPGQHTLTIRVDNRMILDIGENSHSVSDHTQGNWNGIVGRIELRATPAVWIEDLQVYPQVATKSVLVKGRLGRVAGVAASGAVELSVKPLAGRGGVSRGMARVNADGAFATTLALGAAAPLWDEFNPALHELTAQFGADQSSRVTKQVRFGLREIATHGTQFTVNGRKTFFRGTLECAIFPKTGHPPTDVAEWKRIIRVARAHGLNLLRFHSWCPPEAAFVAADELGFYLQVECSSWANQSTTLGDGKPVDAWIYSEADRILKAYGNHPSFVLFLFGNEPGGSNHKPYLAQWTKHYQALDSRRLVGSGAGWPEIPENQLHVLPEPRVQGWGQGLNSRINGKPPETSTDYRDYIARRSVPVISHEIGQWCVYPNLAEMPKYTGYLKARNFEIFRDRLEANGLGALAKPFLRASGKLQALCYKEDIESALRTPGMGGFQLLDLHDFPGQGTALVGVLDPFWEEKGYISAKEYSRFCNTVVPLARLPKRVFTADETFVAQVELANFGAQPIAAAVLEWRLVARDGSIRARGTLGPQLAPVDNALRFGEVRVPLNHIAAPEQGRFVVRLAGTLFENDWDIWVYPAAKANQMPAADVLVTSTFDETAQTRLAAGGKVLLTIPGQHVRNFEVAPVKLGFSSIFWNTAWTMRQAPTTLGILCDPKHPALALFPTESHSNWQWWYLIHRAGALRLDSLPPGTKPVVRVIDDWVTARPLGLVIEANVGQGKMVICGFDLTDENLDPVSRQMRASLLDYMESNRFQPAVRVSDEQVQELFSKSPGLARQGAGGRASSAQPGHAASLAIDGDPGTFWHSAYDPVQKEFPHALVVELARAINLHGFTALPRQDENPNGWIKHYEFYVSEDGANWGRPVAKGEFVRNAELKSVMLSRPGPAKFLKLVALSGHAAGPWASLAELRVLSPDAK